MAYKKRAERKRARGGKAEGNLYDAKGSPEAREAEDNKDEFRRGGGIKARDEKDRDERKRGGKVDGERAMHHLGKRARGGNVVHKGRGLARGGGAHSPFSSAHSEADRGGKRGSPSDNAPDGP